MDLLALAVDGFILGEPFVANGLSALADAAALWPRLSLLVVTVVTMVTLSKVVTMVVRKVMRKVVQTQVRPPVPPPVAQPAVPEVRERGCQTPVREMMMIDFVRASMRNMGLDVSGCKGDLLKRGFEHVRVMNDMV